jgi:hypothetical protein
MTPFQLGMNGQVANEMHQIIGRIRYSDDEDEWDEWLLLSAAGAYRWFSDSDDVGLVLWYPFTPAQPVDPRTINRGTRINLGETSAVVRSRGTAAIDYLEGELTWKARVGDTMNYAEAVEGNTLYSVEWTEDEVEFYRGERQDRPTIENAFGVQYDRTQDGERVAAADAAAGGYGGYRGCLSPSGLVVVVVVVLILACVVMSMVNSSGVGGVFIPGGGISTGSPGRSLGGGGGGGGGK